MLELTQIKDCVACLSGHWLVWCLFSLHDIDLRNSPIAQIPHIFPCTGCDLYFIAFTWAVIGRCREYSPSVEMDFSPEVSLSSATRNRERLYGFHLTLTVFRLVLFL